MRKIEGLPSIRIAVSQFPIVEDVLANEAYIIRHMELTYRRGASVIHFPETALSGYDTPVASLDWPQIDGSVKRVQSCAARYRMHVVFGVHQKNPQSHKPFNATIVFSDSGTCLGSYQKVNLYGRESERFEHGSGLLVVDINDICCGFLICFDSCFPHLFDEYRDKGVRLLFLSYYNAGSSHQRNSLHELMEDV